MAMKVRLQHKELGEIIIRNVTEIHFGYAPRHNSVAFESDDTGCTYRIDKILEFEAEEE